MAAEQHFLARALIGGSDLPHPPGKQVVKDHQPDLRPQGRAGRILLPVQQIRLVVAVAVAVTGVSIVFFCAAVSQWVAKVAAMPTAQLSEGSCAELWTAVCTAGRGKPHPKE